MSGTHLWARALPPPILPARLQVQIIRIQLRVPEFGWTTQKVFHLLNFLVCGLRCAVFAFRSQVQDLPYTLFQAALLDLPGGGPALPLAPCCRPADGPPRLGCKCGGGRPLNAWDAWPS